VTLLNEFEKRKQERERGITNEQFYEDIKDLALNSEQAMLVVVNKDGTVETNYTGGQRTIMIGALEWAKLDALGVYTEDNLIIE
jgi:hypothetical protein